MVTLPLGSCPGTHEQRDIMLIYVWCVHNMFLMLEYWCCWKSLVRQSCIYTVIISSSFFHCFKWLWCIYLNLFLYYYYHSYIDHRKILFLITNRNRYEVIKPYTGSWRWTIICGCENNKNKTTQKSIQQV